MTTTLSTARTNVRDMLDEAAAQFWTDAQLNLWLNQGVEDINRRALCLRQIAQVAVTANTQNFAAPADMLQIYRVEFIPTTGTFTYPLSFMGWQEADQAWGTYQSFPAAWPEIFTLWNNPGRTTASPPTLTIRLFPVPSQSGTLNMLYYRQAVNAVADGDQLDTIPGWEDLAEEYCIYKAKRKAKEPDWQDAFAFYEQRLNDMIMVTGTFQDQAGTFSTGQSSWPPWANNMLNSGEW